ncbi:DUF1543 domain-containing protein [Acetobacter sp.]|uniref:DUF1543 domain-containing protein n=1 Tax=Acetobacter sp. TaxID=440 RepID=UPI0039EB2091
MKLFAFYLGGSAPGSNIELHDVQFAAAEKPEDAWPDLIKSWFGTRKSLHVDAYGEVKWADGFSVTLSREKPESANRLYFINMGGYLEGALREEHESTFLVAETAEQAKEKALKSSMLAGLYYRHKDNLMEVDDCILLERIGEMYVHLTPQPDGTPFAAEWQGYQPI